MPTLPRRPAHLLALLALTALAAACAAPPRPAATPQPTAAASTTHPPIRLDCGPPAAPSPADLAAEAQIDAESDTIFTGEILALGAEPTFLSGEAPATQTVTVKLASIEKGAAAPGETVDVDVVVVACAPFVTVGAGGLPALDPSALRPGRRLRFSAFHRPGGHFQGWRMIDA
jgi:hypothetical protein